MDSLTYHYLAGTNKLDYVRDAVSDGNYGVEVDIKNQSALNYDYDRIGNLMSDAKGNVSHIAWNVYGKIRSVVKTNGDTISYGYNSAGNRVEKRVAKGSIVNRYIYIRDAQCNVLSVYRDSSDVVKLEEQHLYGSSRLGMWKYGKVLPADTTPTGLIYDSSLIGSKEFELTNHLGNVVSVISDKKVGAEATGGLIDYYKAEVLNQHDYYPFGMFQPNRKYSVSDGYRYGFNSKEMDNEVSGDGNQYDYGFRIYNPRIGRFLSVDPLTNKYPELTPYQFAANMPVIAIDLDGEEAKIVTIYHSAYTGKEFFRTTATYNAVATQFLSTTQTIHKYAFSTPNGIEYKQVGPSELTFIQPVNFQTGRIDLTKQTMIASTSSFVFGKKVSPEFRAKVSTISKNLGMDPNNLMAIMAFETGGSFSPSQKNAVGSSGTGLIQFMNSTAKALGTTTEALSKMSGVEQLDYVEKYLSTYKGKLKTLEDAYMAVLWPKAVGKKSDYVMFTKYKVDKDGNQVEALAYKQNAGLDTDDDGNITKQEVSAVIREKYKQGEKQKN